VGDAALVEEGEGARQVVDDGGGLVLGEVDALLDLRQQRAAERLLEDEVEVVVVLEEVLKLETKNFAVSQSIERYIYDRGQMGKFL
jgi:hypothetical protein